MLDHYDEAPDRDGDDVLERIARILGVPTANFFEPGPFRPASRVEELASDEEVAQALAVMRLFLRLQDPEARARCVTFITQELLHDR